MKMECLAESAAESFIKLGERLNSLAVVLDSGSNLCAVSIPAKPQERTLKGTVSFCEAAFVNLEKLTTEVATTVQARVSAEASTAESPTVDSHQSETRPADHAPDVRPS